MVPSRRMVTSVFSCNTLIESPSVMSVTLPVKVSGGAAISSNTPFGFFQIVPETVRTGVAGGFDALDADVLVLSEDFDEFLGQIGEEIFHRCSLLP